MRSRHIGIRYFFIRDRVKSGEIKRTDLLTKPLEGILFQELKVKILGGMTAPELNGSVGKEANSTGETAERIRG
jgi:hypothetical protein